MTKKYMNTKQKNGWNRLHGMRYVVPVVLVGVLLAATGRSLAATRTWGGDGIGELASTAANWKEGHTPDEGDDIVLGSDTNKNMTWDLDLPVQSWTQDGYVGTVTVATVYEPTGFTNFTIHGDCVISNGVWTQTANPAVNYETNRLRVTVGGNLTIGPDGAINVSGKGYTQNRGPGAPHNEQYSASYGGRGRMWYGGPVRPCYGSIAAPVNLGSGGASGGWGSTGGGAIMLNVGGTFCHNGLIISDGNPADKCSGSGGSIWLVSGTLSGAGVIRASGGVATYHGGGGRIALTVTNAGSDFSLYTGTISASAGQAVSGAGTLYLRTAGQKLHEGTLIVDNNNLNPSGHTEISSNVTGTVVQDVILRGKGVLALATNQTLTVNGIWSNDAAFVAHSGSQVIFAGNPASTSIVYGSTTFMGLTCTNPGGKTMVFEAGKITTIAAYGQVTWLGEAAPPNLILRSTSDGTSWKLNVNGSTAQSVQYVDVKNSDALSGAPVGAFNSIDRGGNFNWSFPVPGQTNAWTGFSNTAWNVGLNWSLGNAPLAEDFVLIPSNCPQYPVLDTDKTLSGGLKIENGAALSLAGRNLTVTTNAVIAGMLTASATETITFLADVDFTDGTFTSADSTLVIGGAENQAVNLANQSYYRINVVNSSGTISFGSGFSAGELRCEAADGAPSLVFHQGENYTLRALVLLGSPAATNIVLRSSASGQKWNLNVTGSATALGVDVEDSDASGGKPIRAISSKNRSGNSNWFFGENWSSWIGANGASFHEASNWSPAGVPDTTSRVWIHGVNTAVIASPATVLELVVSGNLTASTNLTVMEDLTVQSGGTVTMDRPVVVSNDVYVLAGGTLTHSINAATEANKLHLSVRGNMNVDTNGAVNVSGKGYGDRKGPGYSGSYGGYALPGFAPVGPCYGSMLAPTHLGSAGYYEPGGGAVFLNVGGHLIHDGLMAADGIIRETTPQGGVSVAPSGGSIWLTCGAMEGAGSVRAHGGANSGGGGRIALVVTNAGVDFVRFSGLVAAYGGWLGAGAGTIYQQCATDRQGRGVVEVKNNAKAGFTDVPSATNSVAGEANHATFRVADGATLRLTGDFTVGDIWLDTANAVLDLGSNTLTVNTRTHELTPGTVANEGTIIWTGLPPGVLIIVK